MSYLTDSYIRFTLKMEYVSKNTIFGLKMLVKSGLEKFILKSLHAGIFITEVVILGTFMKSLASLFTIVFRPKMVFLDTDSILRVKPMYESVK